MAPSTAPLNLDVDAISGIAGSISIACWVVVFSPQIIENFQRGSANGLSLQFIIVWLLGDVFNILGAVLQGVLPTMLILAFYYTLADMVLLGQMFYYRGITWRDDVVLPTPKKKKRKQQQQQQQQQQQHPTSNGANELAPPPPPPDERTRLLGGDNHHHPRDRRDSDWSDRLAHLNPANPILEPIASGPPPPSTTLQSAGWNTFCVLIVTAAGVLGWWLSRSYGPGSADGGGDDNDNNNNHDHDGAQQGNQEIRLDLWGQIFGWLCAVLYLGSRLPQLLLNFRRKSTEGVSMLFFLFACLGNLTYVLSIFAFDPKCASSSSSSSSAAAAATAPGAATGGHHHENNGGVGGDGGNECAPGEAARIYGRYMLVNLSWLAGSLGTLLLDMGIFIQFFLYADRAENDSAILEEGDDDYDDDDDDYDDETSIDGEQWDQRPILSRSYSPDSD